MRSSCHSFASELVFVCLHAKVIALKAQQLIVTRAIKMLEVSNTSTILNLIYLKFISNIVIMTIELIL